MSNTNDGNLSKNEILDLANSLNSKSEKKEHENLMVSALYMNNEIGYPLRIFEEESNKREGEPKNFDEAYDIAQSLFHSEDFNIYQENEFVWFKPE